MPQSSDIKPDSGRPRPRFTLLTMAGLAAILNAAVVYYQGTGHAAVYGLLGAALIGIDSRFDALEQ